MTTPLPRREAGSARRAPLSRRNRGTPAPPHAPGERPDADAGDVSHLLHGPDQRDGGLGDPGDPGPILGLDEPVRHHP